MAITQRHITQLLDAAEEYIYQFENLAAVVAMTCAQVTGNEITHEVAIQRLLATAIKRDERLVYLKETVALERARHDLTYNKNIIERERMRARRAGIPFRTWMLHKETALQVGEPSAPMTTYKSSREREAARDINRATQIMKELTDNADAASILPAHPSIGPADDEIINFDPDNMTKAEVAAAREANKIKTYEKLKADGLCKHPTDFTTCKWPNCNCDE